MAAMTTRPNMVLILADQWRGDCLGVARSAHPVMTPHLDQLACEGTRFAQAYADCPICMPVRATLLTGQSASHLGLVNNFSGSTPTLADATTSLPARLAREAGYQTKAIGKMHFNPERARCGFEHVALHPNDYVNWLEEHGWGGFYRGHGLGGNEVYPAVSAVPERYTHTHWIIDEGIRFISQRDPDAPFFLLMVFESPHSPFDPPEPYERMYDRFNIPAPVHAAWQQGDFPPVLQQKIWARKYDWVGEDALREIRRRYYGQLTYIDYQLARFLGELKSKGLYDNTAVVFTADHGEHLGDHGLFDKYTFYNASCRVPLIMRLPSAMKPMHYAVVDAPVTLADIPTTLLEIAGLPRGADMDGHSLLAAPSTRRIVCGETNHSVFASDGNYQYIYYFHGGIEQLFDARRDPDNRFDLHAMPEHQSIQQSLKTAVVDYLQHFNRPAVQNGQLAVFEYTLDEAASRARNESAWRGPLRYGQGYGSW